MKRNLVYVIVLLLILIIGVGAFWYFTRTYVFGGSVVSVNGSTIVAQGQLTISSMVPIGNKVVQNTTLNIQTTNSTKLTRLALHIPANAQSFNPSDLKQEETATTLDVVSEDAKGARVIGIEANLKQVGNSYVANSIYFRVPVFE